MFYCPANVSLFDIWVNKGTSQCFMDTITNAFLLTYLLVFGLWELWMYRKYGTPQSFDNLPKSKLYLLQLFITYFLSVLAIVRFFVQLNYVYNGQVYGFMVIAAAVPVIIFPFSAYLIKVERYNMLPTAPGRGHSVTLLLFWTFLFAAENMAFMNLRRDDWWFHMKTTPAKIEMALFITRYVCCLLAFVLGLRAPGIMTSRDYFNLNQANDRNPENGRTQEETSTWQSAWKKMRMLGPFLWPKKSCNLQFRVILCVIMLLSGRLINVLTPIYSKLIVNSMTGDKPDFRWDYVLIFVGVKFLQGGGTGSMGLLNNLRSFLWIKVQQYTTREVKLELFRHLHSLSLKWHLSRKTGEVLRIMDRGTDSINGLLSLILFQIIPTFLDIIIAIMYFVTFFGGWFGLIIFVTMALYLTFTIYITEWRTKYQRRMNQADNKAKARSVDSLLNFETVKYYGAEEYEVEQYKEAILIYQDEQWMSSASLNILNSIQNITICVGLLGGSLLCVYEVVETKSLTVGDYVLFASYLTQLYMPLNWFGTFYRQIQNSFVDMENMFDLLSEEPEVIDSPSASPLTITNGEVEFRNVAFSYIPERPVLKNLSFKVDPGKTIALVGPSGSGKTTIIRLLFRFYEVNSGYILIDGQNIQMVTQKSLRKAIGVVPQDTVLFNNTIEYNIQYGRPGASHSEMVNAAENADIHERILTFPDKYDTQVGERGLKLSGGEKQRVAIARTILKSPLIVLLDEATSSLDTLSERHIQAALTRICNNRTTIIVAHRLSTIIHADEILVLRNGEIFERGRHQELINSNGLYATMWQQQLENDRSNDAAVAEQTTTE
ncbi:hypothetical protein V9T40_001728 [Parthenolecanium corni]|uniref:ATP-binding cassette sub-family B member 6 n=1 Tax=Parthenolecanium corni TaxID=536013 RepID=A0AAN9Y4N5_9HEMI